MPGPLHIWICSNQWILIKKKKSNKKSNFSLKRHLKLKPLIHPLKNAQYRSYRIDPREVVRSIASRNRTGQRRDVSPFKISSLHLIRLSNVRKSNMKLQVGLFFLAPPNLTKSQALYKLNCPPPLNFLSPKVYNEPARGVYFSFETHFFRGA